MRGSDILDPFQVDLVDDLTSYLGFGNQALLVAPTGSGKTTVARATAEILIQVNRFVGALVLVPQNQIKDAWTRNMVIAFPPTEDAAVTQVRPAITMGGNGGVWQQRTRKNTRNEHDNLRSWLSASFASIQGYVSTQQGFARWVAKGKLLPSDLSKRLLIVDEAHRAGTCNKLGSAIKQWLAAGGSVLYVTATPFRTSGDLPIPDDIATAYRSMAEHVSSGKYSPRNVEVRFRQLSYEAKSVQVLVGDRMPEADIERLSREFLALWLADGCPKAVVVVPQYGSERWAACLERVLSERARVHVAVGTGADVQQRLCAVLHTEREAARHGQPSTVDVIVACKRFDEGTDWPWCSDVYNLGLPSTLLLIIQRLGRALRLKLAASGGTRKGIEGYNPEHADRARITFLLPKNSVQTWHHFETRAKDYAFMVACFMQDVGTGREYVNEVRDRVGDLLRRRSGDRRAAEAAWKEIEKQLGMLREDVHAYTVKLKEAAIAIGKRKPTFEELRAVLVDRMGVTPNELRQLLRVHLARAAARNPVILRAVDANVTMLINKQLLAAGVQTKQEFVRIIRECMQAAFDNVVEEVMADNESLMLEAEESLEVLAGFTGEQAQDVAYRLADRVLHTDLSWLTLPILDEMIQSFFKATGRPPTTNPADSADYCGRAYAWVSVSARARRTLGVSVPERCAYLGLEPRKIPQPRARLLVALQGFVATHNRLPIRRVGADDDLVLVSNAMVTTKRFAGMVRRSFKCSVNRFAFDYGVFPCGPDELPEVLREFMKKYQHAPRRDRVQSIDVRGRSVTEHILAKLMSFVGMEAHTKCRSKTLGPATREELRQAFQVFVDANGRHPRAKEKTGLPYGPRTWGGLRCRVTSGHRISVKELLQGEEHAKQARLQQHRGEAADPPGDAAGRAAAVPADLGSEGRVPGPGLGGADVGG